MIRQIKQNQEVVVEGRITIVPAIATLIFAGLDVIVLIILSRITKSGFINASILFWVLLVAALAFSLYSLWLANSEKLLLENDRIVYKSQKERFIYEYNSIKTVYIQKKTGGRGFHRDYLIIPINKENTSSRVRKKLVMSIATQGEIHRIAQYGHLICIIRNQTEGELLYSFLHDKINIVYE